MATQATSTLLNSAIATSQQLLTEYAVGENLVNDLTTAFGSSYDGNAAANLIEQWQTGEFGSFPNFEIRSANEINGANGAFSADTNTIYIAEEYLLANAANQNAVVSLVLEEFGHFVDSQINAVDSAGDEGAIFSGLVRGESFSDAALQRLQLENDQAVVNIDGQNIVIEQQADIHDHLFNRTFDQNPRHVADINNDGNADIIYFGDDNVLTALSNGDGTFEKYKVGLSNDFTVNQGGWSSFDKFPRQLADINNDGNADIIGFKDNAVFTALSRGDGTFENTKVTVEKEFTHAKGWKSFDKTPRQVVDLNNDGYADIIGFGTSHVFTALNNKDGTFQPAKKAISAFTSKNGGWSSFDELPRQVADINGDGYADIIGFGTNSVFTALNKGDGTGTFEAVKRTSKHLDGFSKTNNQLSGSRVNSFNRFTRLVADINGDNNADIIAFSSRGFSLHYLMEKVILKRQKNYWIEQRIISPNS